MPGERYNPAEVEDFQATIIRKLVQRRKALKLTQQEVGQLIGVADNLVGKWEARMRLPSGFLLYCWGEALGLKMHFKRVS